jgi:hypothetical protein
MKVYGIILQYTYTVNSILEATLMVPLSDVIAD